MKSYLFSLVFLCFAYCLSFSQDLLDVRGDGRIQDDLTIESLSGSDTRQVLVDANGKLIVSPSAHVLTIGPSAFNPIEESAVFLNNGVILIPRPSVTSLGQAYSPSFQAPVQLPDQVTIDSVAFHFVDTDSDMFQDIVLSIHRITHLNDTNFNLGQLFSTTTSMSFNDYKRVSSTLTGPQVVNNRDYYYFLSIDPFGEWKSDAGLVFKSAVIYYSYL